MPGHWGLYIGISTHAPAGGATQLPLQPPKLGVLFLLTPLREGRPRGSSRRRSGKTYFYSRPCGRGDRTRSRLFPACPNFYSRPCGRGDAALAKAFLLDKISTHAPAGGATRADRMQNADGSFLLTPLREGRQATLCAWRMGRIISTHAPAGGATSAAVTDGTSRTLFLLTPLREGRHFSRSCRYHTMIYFYSY